MDGVDAGFERFEQIDNTLRLSFGGHALHNSSIFCSKTLSADVSVIRSPTDSKIYRN